MDAWRGVGDWQPMAGQGGLTSARWKGKGLGWRVGGGSVDRRAMFLWLQPSVECSSREPWRARPYPRCPPMVTNDPLLLFSLTRQ